MTAWPRQRPRCRPPAASRRGPGTPLFQAVIAGQVRPEAGARHRAPFLQPVHSRARVLHPRAQSLGRLARVVHQRVQLLSKWVWSSLAFPLFRPMSSEGGGRLSVRSTSRLRAAQSYSKNGHMMEDYEVTVRQSPGIRWAVTATAQPNGASLSNSVPFGRREAHAIRGPGQVGIGCHLAAETISCNLAETKGK